MNNQNYFEFGPKGFRDGKSKKQLRDAFYKVLVEEKCAHRDIDGFTIIGDPVMIPDLFGKYSKTTTSIYLPKNVYSENDSDYLFVTSTPYNLWVPAHYKNDIIKLYQERRSGVAIIPHSKPQLLFNVPHYISTYELDQILKALDIKKVAIISFGDKAPFTWGMEVMEVCRRNDPDCEIDLDCAVQLIPECLHWINQDHRVPLPANGVPNEGYVPLVSLTDRSFFDAEFSSETKVEHNPLFVVQQLTQDLHQDNTAGYPNRGGVTFHPAKKPGCKHQSVKRVKVYPTTFSQWRENSTRSLFKENIHPTIYPYLQRLKLLSGEHFVGCFSSMFPQLRIEVSCTLQKKFNFKDRGARMTPLWVTVI